MSTRDRRPQFPTEHAEIYHVLARTGAGFKSDPALEKAKAAFVDALNAKGSATAAERLETGCAGLGSLLAALVTTAERYAPRKNELMQDELADQMANRVAFWMREYLILHNKAQKHGADKK